LASDHGFYYEHFKAIFESYRESWGEGWNEAGGGFPPTTTTPQPTVFPWDSVETLENQMKEEGIDFTPLPRLKSKN
jgi:hypothetical protein